jgi:hypothetical protein
MHSKECYLTDLSINTALSSAEVKKLYLEYPLRLYGIHVDNFISFIYLLTIFKIHTAVRPMDIGMVKE